MSNLLYAEDDRDCRELFAFALRQNGHAVFEALNGAQAVQIVREEPIDLAILDARMPMMTGYEAARILAREKPDLPIVFFSARGLHREIKMAFASSPMVIDYLVKPISPLDFVSRVNHILEECRIRGIDAVRTENMSKELLIQW
ncbi:MAG: response regulator [Chloroflexi bacterium]|nr:MAG: response regulator [Chloroflexota bacterium]